MPDPRCPEALRTPATVPIWGINPDGSCACNRPTCGDAGKHQRPYGHPVALNGEGYGIRTGSVPNGSGIFVVDLDEKPALGVSGLARFRELCISHGHDLPGTLIVATGGGGFHLFFVHPGFPVKSSVSKLAKGIDIRGEGGYVVGPGSLHRNGRAYYVAHNAPVANAPEWLLAWPGLRADARPELSADMLGAFAPQFVKEGTAEYDRNVQAFISECRGESGDLRPGVQGSHGSTRLVHAAKRGTLYWCLPPEVAARILWEHYDPRCSPSWREDKQTDAILRACIRAVQTNTEPCQRPPSETWGADLVREAITGVPAEALDGAIPPRDPAVHSETCTCGGGEEHVYRYSVGDSIANGKLASRSLSHVIFLLHRHPDWQGVLRYDEFHERTRAVQPPIALDCETNYEGLTTRDISAIKVWCECAADLQVSAEALAPAIEAAASCHRYHPVRAYLASLPAGDPRVLDNLGTEWFGAPADDRLSNELVKRFLVAAVRRIMWPGTQLAKVDSMLVLVEPRGGMKKSQWIDTLWSRDWATHQLPDLSKSSDVSNQISRKAVIEFAELDKLLRADANTAKDMITREVDEFRRAYGRDTLWKPRQCVLVGTTNDPEYVRSDFDDAFLRRLWTIPVRKPIPIEMVAAMRDEVWAAAVALAYDSTFEHWIDRDTELDAALMLRHRDTRDEDPWLAPIRDYCAGKDWVTGSEIFRVAITKGDPQYIEKFKKREQREIGRIIRVLGGVPHPRYENGVQVKGYRLPEDLRRARPSSEALRERTAIEGRELKVLIGEANNGGSNHGR